tara:strand:- start:402 stop:1382 length:981 start_codon:yes stop_codon:yes gene_type:complete
MKIALIGEAANHEHQLVAGLGELGSEVAHIIALPREAAFQADFDEELTTCDVVVSLKMKREHGKFPPIPLLHVPGAGLDGIDLSCLQDLTTVCNVFEHEGPIAEFVIASMLEWEMNLDSFARSFTREVWPQIYRNRPPHGEIKGKTLGLIGYGRIGQAIAKLARPFGVNVLAIDASVTEESDGIMPTKKLPFLLKESDYLVIACPLTDSTRGLINNENIKEMKNTSVIINISRAEIVLEEAFFTALKERWIRGASIDVWYRYPQGSHDESHPSQFDFHSLENTRCTPHISAWTTEMMDRRYKFIAKNILSLFNNKPLTNVVRPSQL